MASLKDILKEITLGPILREIELDKAKNEEARRSTTPEVELATGISAEEIQRRIAENKARYEAGRPAREQEHNIIEAQNQSQVEDIDRPLRYDEFVKTMTDENKGISNTSPELITPDYQKQPFTDIEPPIERNEHEEWATKNPTKDPRLTVNENLAAARGYSLVNKNPRLSTQSAIDSGYVSEEMVKLVRPDLANNPTELRKVSVGEVQQRTGLVKQEDAQANAKEMQEAAFNEPKPVPASEITKLAQIKTAIKRIGRIKGDYFNLLAKGKSPVDPVKGRFVQLADSFKLLDDQEVAKFTGDIKGNLNRYLNELSGAAISTDEAKRLQSRLASIASTGPQFLADIDSVTDELQDILDSNYEVLAEANYKIKPPAKAPPTINKPNETVKPTPFTLSQYNRDKTMALKAIKEGKDPDMVLERLRPVYGDKAEGMVK